MYHYEIRKKFPKLLSYGAMPYNDIDRERREKGTKRKLCVEWQNIYIYI